MENKNNIGTEQFALYATGLGGAISVASAGGAYDFIDMAIGIILLALILPALRSPDVSDTERKIASAIAGITLILILGAFIDNAYYLLPYSATPMLWEQTVFLLWYDKLTILIVEKQLGYFLLWGLCSAYFYLRFKRIADSQVDAPEEQLCCESSSALEVVEDKHQ
ncbi:hypothetical protein [Alteromonas ponticola]|uniref:Uncharacterized protein n=1 Tax=Alteromonas ponticola TaxID=2720613 RepID=A0ABX1R3I5_9ALTE|nr:hypothetical protein [Alteromonas ponticola]NMH61007.1 hypothetical protein [Alteromonas ponticola]